MLNSLTTSIQYVSDTVGSTQILPASSSISYSSQSLVGLFIPDGTYNSAININNKGYQDIIVNSSTFPMNTDTLLGNTITRIYLKSDTAIRTYQANCFNNLTLKDIYFMTPNVSTTLYLPTSTQIPTVCTATQKADITVKAYTMNPT